MIDCSKKEAELIHARCMADPIFHIEEIQGCKTLEPYQRKILEAVANYDRVAIQSCHDMGKTFTGAKIVLWFTSSFRPSKTVTTAPTFNQVKRLLWSEIRAGWRKSKVPLGGSMLQTEWNVDEEHFAIGFTSKGDSAGAGEGQGKASGFQGFHAPWILIFFDEATGILRSIWIQGEGMMTSARVKWIAIGNPTSRSSEFYRCFSDPSWHKIKISCFDSPNLIANGITDMGALRTEVEHVKTLSDAEAMARFKSYKVVQPQLLSTAWVIAMGIKWGLTHPLFISKVLGEWPEEDDNVMIRLIDVEDAQRRHENNFEDRDKSQVKIRSIGIDPARYGPDNTVITILEDNFQTMMKKMPKIPKSTKTDPAIETVNFVLAQLKDLPRVKREVIAVDTTGIGAAIVSGLILAQQDRQNGFLRNVEIRELHFGEQCEDIKDKEDFANLKAKIFKLLSNSLKDDLAIKPENAYLEQLPLIIYSFTPKGQLIIESKDDFKKRTGLSSPDEADSLAIANFGRMDTRRVGNFTDDMTKRVAGGKTLIPGKGGGPRW